MVNPRQPTTVYLKYMHNKKQATLISKTGALREGKEFAITHISKKLHLLYNCVSLT